jgi:hypothetical protein
MQNIERQVWREARAMTRREVITKAIAKQLTWIQASEILGVSARHMRRLRRQVECWGMSAVMDQRGGRPRRKRIKAGTIELLCRRSCAAVLASKRGSFVVAEEREDGILIRPATVLPAEIYTPERRAEFILNNAVAVEDYRRARAEVKHMGLDPDRIKHHRPAKRR